MPEDTTPAAETPAPAAQAPMKSIQATIAIPYAAGWIRKLCQNEDDCLKSILEVGPQDGGSSILIYDITKGAWRAPGTLLAWSPEDDRTDEIEQAFMNGAIAFAKAYVANHDDPAKNPAPAVQEGWLWVDEAVIENWFKGILHDHGTSAFNPETLEALVGNPEYMEADIFESEISYEMLYESFVRHVFKK